MADDRTGAAAGRLGSSPQDPDSEGPAVIRRTVRPTASSQWQRARERWLLWRRIVVVGAPTRVCSSGNSRRRLLKHSGLGLARPRRERP